MIMSKIIHRTGNLLDLARAGEFDVIVHGCNCFNTMGGGIAREIADRYPGARAADIKTEYGDYNKLGTYTTHNTGRFVIVNAYTQYDMSNGTDVFEYLAFSLILQKLAHEFPGKRIGFPYIGCGLAGGDKETIVRLIEAFAEQYESTGITVSLVEFA